jgi:hypothetical protein
MDNNVAGAEKTVNSDGKEMGRIVMIKALASYI